MYSDENPRTNTMKRTILFITSLVLITSVSFSQSKVNINNLVQYGDKMFEENDDEPYTGKVFDLYKSNGNKKLEGFYRDGLMISKWTYWTQDGSEYNGKINVLNEDYYLGLYDYGIFLGINFIDWVNEVNELINSKEIELGNITLRKESRDEIEYSGNEDGQYLILDENMKLVEYRNFIEGELFSSIDFYDNGNKKSQSGHDGTINYGWLNNGQLLYENNQNRITWWYDNGNKRLEIIDDIQSEWYNYRSKLRSQGRINKEGLKYGEWIEWDYEGKYYEKGTYEIVLCEYEDETVSLNELFGYEEDPNEKEFYECSKKSNDWKKYDVEKD